MLTSSSSVSCGVSPSGRGTRDKLVKHRPWAERSYASTGWLSTHTTINTVTYSAHLWVEALPPRRGGRKLARGERFLRTPGDGTTTTPPWRGGRTGVPAQILSEQVRLPLPGRVGQVDSIPGVRKKRSPLAKLLRPAGAEYVAVFNYTKEIRGISVIRRRCHPFWRRDAHHTPC